MAKLGLKVHEFLAEREGLPHPEWELVRLTIEGQFDERDQRTVWIQFARDWFDELAEALPDVYEQGETDHFLLLAPAHDHFIRALMQMAEESRRTLLEILPGIARFDVPGKQLVVAFGDREIYYQYISAFYSEGAFGGSAGMHLRAFHPHIALWGFEVSTPLATLAHETLHASLTHLELPQWIEEGLAQMFEHDMAGRQAIQMTKEIVAKQKQHWRRHGLNEFWRGDGFSAPDEAQEYSYQLAEILMRLLVEDHRPTWFGWNRDSQRKLMDFLRFAHRDDCGAGSARDHLQCELSEIAEKFLGFGDWDPKV